MTNPMTPEQVLHARHALGLPNDGMRSDRNHFLAARGTPAHEIWRAMVEANLARRDERGLSEKADHFWLTRAGAERSLFAGESLDPEDFPTLGQD